MASSIRSFEPPSGILVPTQRRLADVISFSSGQLLGTPENALRLLNADEKPTDKFALFSNDFIQLQLVTAQALALPVAIGSFDEKYGTFSSKETVVKCVTALDNLSKHCNTFGNPAKLATEIQKLGAGDKPASIYGQIVWLSYKIASTALTFNLNFMTIATMLGQIPSAEDRCTALKQILGGKGGLVTEAENMEKHATKLRNDLVAYTLKMTEIKGPISTYFGVSGELCTEAVNKHKDITDRLSAAQSELATARDDYVKYCAAAAGSSVGLMLISGGMAWPLAATAGGVLGSLAEEARKKANQIEEEIGRLNVEGAKKAKLVMDVKGLQAGVTPVESYLGKVCDSLATIAGVWGKVAFDFSEMVKETKPEALKDLGEFLAASRIVTAQGKWKDIATATSQFTERAFIQIQTKAA